MINYYHSTPTVYIHIIHCFAYKETWVGERCVLLCRDDSIIYLLKSFVSIRWERGITIRLFYGASAGSVLRYLYDTVQVPSWVGLDCIGMAEQIREKGGDRYEWVEVKQQHTC